MKGSALSVISEQTRKKIREMLRKYQEKSLDASARSCFSPLDAYGSGLISKRDFRSGLREMYGVAHPSGRVPFDEWLEVEDLKELMAALLVPGGRRSRSRSGGRTGNDSSTSSSSMLIRYDSFLGYAGDSIEEPAEADLHRSLQEAAFKKSKYTPENLLSLFEKIDVKKKGFLRHGEFVRIVRKVYSALSGREEKLLKGKLDATGEGIADYYGFVWWLGIGRPDCTDEVRAMSYRVECC